ncbi:MAG: hypothetical protein I4N51_19460, partial [Acinetobacter sp.]|nr:hypothetical protein [Acinetobacter sp.]
MVIANVPESAILAPLASKPRVTAGMSSHKPTLADIKDKTGQTVPAIYVLTKTGNAFVLDRRNGKAIVPINERPV